MLAWSLAHVAHDDDAASDFVLLFSESPTRFLIEVRPSCQQLLAEVFNGLPLGRLGEVTSGAGGNQAARPRLVVRGLDESVVIDADVADLKAAWQRPLAWS